MSAPQLLVSLFVSVWLVGCGDSASDQPSQPEQQASRELATEGPAPKQVTGNVLAPLAPLQIAAPEARWSESETAAPRRAALVVGANRAKEDRISLHPAKRAADEFTRVLSELKYEVITLTDDEVHRDQIQFRIKELTRSMQAQGNVLVVAWIGHGWLGDSGQQLACADSSWNDSELRIDNPIMYADLLQWVGTSQQAVRRDGGQLSTVMMVDACKVPIQGIGGMSLSWNPEEADVQIFSAGDGLAAFINKDQIPYFTAGICKALSDRYRPARGSVGGSTVGLHACLQQALQLSPDLRKQEPQWVGREGLMEFPIYDSEYLSLTVRVVDANTQLPIQGATLSLAGTKEVGPEAQFTGLVPMSSGYALRVDAPGYFGRSQLVALDLIESNMALDMPLVPAFIAVEGSVRLKDGAGQLLRVSLEGLGTPVDPKNIIGSGKFRFQVGTDTDACQIVVRLGSEELHRASLSLGELAEPRRHGSLDVLTYVHDPIRLDSVAPVVGGGMIDRRIGSLGLQIDFTQLLKADFKDGGRTYDSARKYAEREDYSEALLQLQSLLASDKVEPGGRRRLNDLIALIALAEAGSAADELQREARAQRKAGQLRESRVTMDRAIDVLLDRESILTEEARSLVSDWLSASAGTWHSLAEYELSLEQLDRQRGLGGDANGIALQQRAVVSDWLNQSYDDALTSGMWGKYQTALKRAKKLDGARIDFAEWDERLRRESISAKCREAFVRGNEHHAREELELARAAYIQALGEPSITTHYLQQVVPLVMKLEEDLYQHYQSIGFELEETDPSAALEAYLHVVHLEPGLKRVIEKLLENPEAKTDPELLVAYRTHAPWRTYVEETRQLLSEKRPTKAYEHVVSAINRDLYQEPGATVLIARAMLAARKHERAAMSQVALLEYKASTEAKRVARDFYASVARYNWSEAELGLRSATRNSRVSLPELKAMEASLTAAKSSRLRKSQPVSQADNIPSPEPRKDEVRDNGKARAATGSDALQRRISDLGSSIRQCSTIAACEELERKRQVASKLSTNDLQMQELQLHAQTLDDRVATLVGQNSSTSGAIQSLIELSTYLELVPQERRAPISQLSQSPLRTVDRALDQATSLEDLGALAASFSQIPNTSAPSASGLRKLKQDLVARVRKLVKGDGSLQQATKALSGFTRAFDAVKSGPLKQELLACAKVPLGKVTAAVQSLESILDSEELVVLISQLESTEFRDVAQGCVADLRSQFIEEYEQTRRGTRRWKLLAAVDKLVEGMGAGSLRKAFGAEARKLREAANADLRREFDRGDAMIAKGSLNDAKSHFRSLSTRAERDSDQYWLAKLMQGEVLIRKAEATTRTKKLSAYLSAKNNLRTLVEDIVEAMDGDAPSPRDYKGSFINVRAVNRLIEALSDYRKWTKTSVQRSAVAGEMTWAKNEKSKINRLNRGR